MERRLEFKLVAPAPTGSTRGSAATRQRRALTMAIHSLQRLLSRLPAEELAFVTRHLEKAVDREERSERRKTTLAEGFGVSGTSRREQLATEIAVLLRSFRRRQDLLRDSLSATEVAEALGTSRQTPHDRAESGSLLAVLDRGSLRFPAWQFDPGGPNGVIDGLPDVLRALGTGPFAKLSWLVHRNTMFEGKTPVDVLKHGDKERVVHAARAVEAD